MKDNQPPEATVYGEYAGFITRLMAFFLDGLILAVIVSAVTLVINFVVQSFGINELLGIHQQTQWLVAILLAALAVVVTVLYDIGFWLLAGQTPGKRAMGVRIVRTDGERVNLGNAVRREIGYVISAILFLGYLWVLVDNRRQAFHDKLAGTLVIYSWPEDAEQALRFTERGQRWRQRRDRSRSRSG